jgi:hypothetical protein
MNSEDSHSEDRLEQPLHQYLQNEFEAPDPISSHFRRLNDLSFAPPPWTRGNAAQPFPFTMQHGDIGDNFWPPSIPHFPRMLSADSIHSGMGRSPFAHPFFNIEAFQGAFAPRRRNQGANRSTINELPTRKFVVPEQKNTDESKQSEVNGSDDNQKSCCICMEDFKDAEDVRTLPCLHIFHTNCIDSWLVKSRTCPICKFDITQNNVPTS